MASVSAPRERARTRIPPGRIGLPVAASRLAAIEEAAHRRRDALGELHLRALLAKMIDGASPSLRRRASPKRGIAGQRKTLPGLVAAPRGVQRRPWLGGQAGVGLGARERGVDGREHLRHGAERQVQRDVVPPAAGCARRPAEVEAHARKPRRHGALKRKDRLLLVADGEEGPRLPRSRPRRRKIPPPACRSPATGAGSCPAPRRPGCGRCRGRACSGSTPTYRSAGGARPCARRGPRNRAGRGDACDARIRAIAASARRRIATVDS